MSYVERWINNGPPKGEYELRGDDGSVMISCRVDYDRDRFVWVARGGDGFVGESDSAVGAVLNCFGVWMTTDRSYYDPKGTTT